MELFSKNKKIKDFKKEDSWSSRSPVLIWKILLLSSVLVFLGSAVFGFLYYKKISAISFPADSIKQDVFIEGIGTKKLDSIIERFEKRKEIFENAKNIVSTDPFEG